MLLRSLGSRPAIGTVINRCEAHQTVYRGLQMSRSVIGVDVDDLGLPTKEALRQAAALGFRVVELGTVEGDVAAWNLSGSGRRHLARLVVGHGLELAALVADMPDLRLSDPATVSVRVERTQKVLELAADIDVPVVTASVKALTQPGAGDSLPQVADALARIGEHADARGRVFGIRPSRDAGDHLVRLLAELDCPAIKLCLDPAAMVMSGVNPLASFDALADRIVLVHARDGTIGSAEHAGRETRLGEGEVDLVGLLAQLGAADYAGAHILRRTDSTRPAEDLLAARDVLKRYLG
jgi:sugar phosphate isomerase/epimerase